MVDADELLVDFERYVLRVSDRAELYHFLTEQPRGLELLVKLFASSRYLTETLLRDPSALRRLVQHRLLADVKSREEFTDEALEAAEDDSSMAGKLDALRRYQRSELLRIGVCDAFGLVDFRTATVQLSLLADGLIEACLRLVSTEMKVDPKGFSVLAMGKLGGEELNYSSDIDLIFLFQPVDESSSSTRGSGDGIELGNSGSSPFARLTVATTVNLAQRLIRALQDATGEGFLYRVDMRLRPWGRAGELVVQVPAYLQYIRNQAELWEKQALLKGRVVAGDFSVGARLLREAAPLIVGHSEEDVRKSVRSSKRQIEADLERRGRAFGEVKSGSGSIRDIEFIVQSLQLVHGQRFPHIRTVNTLDALVRLSDVDLIQADEYRCLTDGYVFLRTIEHSLQLLQNRQEHLLPTDPQEMTALARRLDFRDGEHFLVHYRQYCSAIRKVFNKYLPPAPDGMPLEEISSRSLRDTRTSTSDSVMTHFTSKSATDFTQETVFSEEERHEHQALLQTLTSEKPVIVLAKSDGAGSWRVRVLGIDHPGELSLICGLLFVYGFDIVNGIASTAEPVTQGGAAKTRECKFVDVFTVRSSIEAVMSEVWNCYESDLTELVQLAQSGLSHEAQGRLASRVADALEDSPDLATKPAPLEVSFDNQSHERFTVLHIRGEDTIGFLYELTNALALSGIAIEGMFVSTDLNVAADILYVTDAARRGKILDERRMQELQAAIVLIKHFTHLLPGSPNPEAALIHFRSFLGELFQQPDWTEQFSSLERPEVLTALAKVLGVSDFLWEDFLRLQYANLFPVLRDITGIEEAKSKSLLWRDLAIELAEIDDPAVRRRALNAFKDREMFRIDLRHILGRCGDFDRFAEELTDVAEVVVSTSLQLSELEFHDRYGVPKCADGDRASMVVCALGKCGGRELGFASDIELLFVYDKDGMTDGRESIANATYYQRLVESCVHAIRARQEGIFRIDLRLRPYGRSGPLAVSLDAFRRYFDPQGAAWPYERQALVKLRPITGDPGLGEKLISLRDKFLYDGPPFDFASMRAMRERQVRQLVATGEFNAKLSPGGLVDIEYFVQAMQITHGSRHASLRVTNTRIAMDEMHRTGVLTESDYRALRNAYGFFRRLIDALRMVRGDARDLTVSGPSSQDFHFLARRLGYGSSPQKLHRDLNQHIEVVNDLVRRQAEVV
ncbi:glutamine synthetase adenylyltransferase [Schlesneria sp. DSM 10557]|uniref:[protein-PII] uridylyltransferase family protein n=1 Tax=Schlesneria sp. DSM 10557 TaxID=3044399 RepID=UPI00359F19C5